MESNVKDKAELTIRFGEETVCVRVARNDAAVNAAIERESKKRKKLADYYNMD